MKTLRRKFIINPRSGKGLRENDLQSMQNFWEAKIGSFDHVVTRDARHATMITRESLKAGYGQIVAVGGDGTVNSVVNGFFENGVNIAPNTLLAVAQTGTGSDYYRGLVEGGTVRHWQDLVTDFSARPVDVGWMRFGAHDRTGRYFVNMMSLGMVPKIIRGKHVMPEWLPSALRYLLPTVWQILTYQPVPVTYQSGDDPDQTKSVITMLVNKGTFAGGGMRLGQGANLDDGKFQVSLIGPVLLWEKLFKMPLLYKSLHPLKNFLGFRTSRILVKSPAGIPVECDGEVCGETPCSVQVLPRALKVCMGSGLDIGHQVDEKGSNRCCAE